MHTSPLGTALFIGFVAAFVALAFVYYFLIRPIKAWRSRSQERRETERLKAVAVSMIELQHAMEAAANKPREQAQWDIARALGRFEVEQQALRLRG